jgi:hypothetical protein
MVESEKRVLRYVVEHYEAELSEWTLCEYTHMLLILGNLYADPVNNTPETTYAHRELVITNFPFVDKFNKGTLANDELDSLKNTERFVNLCKSLKKSAPCYVTSLSFQQLTSSSESSEGFQDDTEYIRSLLLSKLKNEEDLANVCFMDFRAEAELTPCDAKTFDFVVFGGILGDHPP